MRLTLLIFVALGFCEALAQPLQMHKTLGGAHFQRDTIYLSHKQVLQILAVDQQASHDFKVAIKNYRVGGLLGFSGAILLAIPVVNAIAGGEPDWLLAGGGALLLGTSVPFSQAFKRHAEIALAGYNSRQVQSRATRPRLYFNGAGFTLKF